MQARAGTGGTGGNAGNAGISQVGGSATSTALTFTQSQVNLQTTAIKATAIAGKGVGSFESSEAYEAAGGTANLNNTGTAGSAGTTAVGQNGAVNATTNGGAVARHHADGNDCANRQRRESNCSWPCYYKRHFERGF